MGRSGTFVQATTVTLLSNVLNFLLGIGTSIILARVLGPEGRGIYALAVLLPSFIVTFGNLGIGSATVYYTARDEFRHQEILGNNLLLSVGIGSVGVLVGLIILLLFRELIFPGVPLYYLLLTLALVPVQIFFSYVRYVLLGTQHIKEFNYLQVIRSIFFLGFISFALVGFRAGITGAILANLLTWLLVDALVFRVAKTAAGGVELKPNLFYIRQATTYGVQAHLANILSFLNYRVDMFIVNGFIGPAAVGLYAVGVGLVE